MREPGVFHPGHDELHGQTVVLYTSGPRTFIGRWDEDTGDMIRMVGVCMHEDGAAELGRNEWVAHTKKYGIPIEHQVITVPKGEVESVVKLRDA